MQANSDTVFLCSKGNAAAIICTQKGCSSNPVMCKEENCECLAPHPKHSHLRARVFLERIREPILPKEIAELNRQMQSFIAMLNQHVGGLQSRHEKLMKSFLNKYFPLHLLKEQLLVKDQPSPSDFTGDSAGSIVEEMDKSKKVPNPYQATVPQLQEMKKAVDAQIASIVKRFEGFFNFEFPVHLKTVHGKCETFILRPSETIEILKSGVHLLTGYPVDQIRLTYKGKELDSKKNLRECDIGMDSDIYIGLKHRGVLTVFVNGPEGISITLKVESNDTVDKIRGKIQQRQGIPSQQQRLVFLGTVMENGRTLGDYHIKNESEIELSKVSS